MAKYVNEVGTPSAPLYGEFIVRGKLLTTGGEVKPCLNVFHFRRFSGPGNVDPTNLLGELTAVINPLLIDACVTRYTIVQTELRFMDDPTAATGVQPVDDPGENTGDGYASDSAVYMLLRTGFRTRNYFGSKHFGGLSEDDTVNDQLDASGITLWGAIATALEAWGVTGQGDSDGSTYKLVVLSTTLSDLEANPSIFTCAEVSDVLLNKTIGTMGGRRQRTIR